MLRLDSLGGFPTIRGTLLGVPIISLGFRVLWWFPKNRGTLFGEPHIKDYRILGSI